MDAATFPFPYPVRRRLLAGCAFILIVVIVLAVLAWPAEVVLADTPVCGPIEADTSWTTGDHPYIVTCDVTVASGVTLTIEPGVEVRFDAGTSLLVDGTLVAEECVFTSNVLEPSPGDWGQIRFSISSVDATFDPGGDYTGGSKIQDCMVEYGGAEVDGAVETNFASPYLVGNTIQLNGASGIHARGRSPAQRVLITDSTISGNVVDIGGNQDGGGLNVVNAAVLGNQINGNQAGSDGHGGGLFAAASEIFSNTVSFNGISAGEAKKGGGIYATDSSVTFNYVSGNAGREQGGGIYASNCTVAGNKVLDNTLFSSEAAYGGGIYATSSSVASNEVTGNSVSTSSSEIARGGGIYANGGTVTGNLVTENLATGENSGLGGGIYSSNNSVTQNDVSGNIADRGGGIYLSYATGHLNEVVNNTSHRTGALFVFAGSATQNTIMSNSAFDAAGIYAVYNSTLTANNVTQNSALNTAGGVFALDSILRGNTISSNDAQLQAGGLYASGGEITNNTISLNTVPAFGSGSGALLSGDVSFTYNTVEGNSAGGGTVGGISIQGIPAQLQFNNIYDNMPYDAEMLTLDPVDATLNYWGPATCTVIGLHIYDGDDMPGRGIMNYAPSLYHSAAMTQLVMPSGLTVLSDEATTVTLSWSPVPNPPDVGCRPPGNDTEIGYRLYYDSVGDCTLNGQDINEGDSPIDVADTTVVTLTGLTPETPYYFSVTAYDFLERESAYPELVPYLFGYQWLYLPSVIK